LSPAQLTTLKQDITVTNASRFATNLANNEWAPIAAYYNTLASPTANLWRPDVTISQLSDGIVWADYETLAQTKQNTSIAMTQSGVLNTTVQSNRDGFTTIFGGGSTTVTNLLAIVKRAGTNFEVLFSGAPVQGARVSTVYGRQCTYIDVAQAVALP
jgi:hypothetical protein